jgi:hypothetical protein
LRVLNIYERNNQKNAIDKNIIDFVDYVLSRLPFRAQTVQTDNGSQFNTQFHWHLKDQGIQHASMAKSGGDIVLLTKRNSTGYLKAW